MGHMTESSHAALTWIVFRLIICVEFLFPHTLASAKCRLRYKEFKISEKAIAEEESAQSEGHQPWRSDAKSVASVGLVQMVPALKVSFVDEMPMKEILKSQRKYVFLYINRPVKKTYRVTVRRFNWRDLRTRNNHLIVLWLTEITVRDCSRKANDQ
jgi:hypothetical protein